MIEIQIDAQDTISDLKILQQALADRHALWNRVFQNVLQAQFTRIPVDTGRLKRSYQERWSADNQWAEMPDGFEVGSHVEYAPFVKMRGTGIPFIEFITRDPFEQIVFGEMESWVNDIISQQWG